MAEDLEVEVPSMVRQSGGVAGGDMDTSRVPATSGESVESTSKLSITGHGLTFERLVPDSVVLRIMRLVLTGESDLPLEPEIQTAAASGNRKESLAEFYRRANPTKYSEKLATIGVYLQESMGRKSFSQDDLRGQFRAVNETAPGNLPRDLKVAMGAGWIAEEHDEPGEFFVTRSGLDIVQAGFGSAPVRKSPKARRRSRVSASTATEHVEGNE